jgi:DNA-nicking Smr family endonuclease
VPSYERSLPPDYRSDEIDLHGLTVDEALPRLDSFLHAAFRAGYYQVRVVHGKGSGILRREVDRYLSNHPLVRSHRLADRYHGGDGATQVDLSEQ